MAFAEIDAMLVRADQKIQELQDRAAKMESALRLIATPKRPDGTYNHCREACEQLAREALESLQPHDAK
jgi:hypothetical protein